MLGLVVGLVVAACGGQPGVTPTAGPVMTSTAAAATATAAAPTATAVPPTALPPVTVTPGGPLVLTRAGQLGRGQAFQMAWSPDGTRLAVGSSVGAYVLDAVTLEVLLLLPTEGWVYLVRYSPDGRTLVGGGVRPSESGGGDLGVAWVWDAADGTLRHTLPIDFWLNDVAIDPSGDLLAVGGLFPTTQAQVWDLNNEAPLFTAAPGAAGEAIGVSVAFSPDGQQLALAGGGPGVTLYQPRTGELLGLLPGMEGPTYDLAFSAPTELGQADGRWLAAGSDGQVALWDMRTRTLARTVAAEGAVWQVALSADGRQLALASGRAVQVVDPATGAVVGGLRTDDPVLSVGFAPGAVLRAADIGQTYSWDKTSGGSVPLSGFTEPVQGLAFLPDGTLLSGEVDTLRVWDVTAGVSLRAWPVAAQGQPALSPDGRQVASGYCTIKDALSEACQDHLVGVWDTASGNLLRSLTAHSGAVNAVAYSADGRWLASAGDDGQVAVWDAAGGGQVYTLTLHSGPVTAVAFTPDSRTLASAGEDGQLILWDVDTGTPRTQLAIGDGSPVYALAFNAAGTLLATGSAAPDSTVRVWRVADGAADPNPLAVLTGHTADIRALVFDPSGQWLVSGGAPSPTSAQDDTVRVWAITASGGQLKETLTPQVGAVFALAFSADGRVLVAGGADGVVAVWVAGATP